MPFQDIAAPSQSRQRAPHSVKPTPALPHLRPLDITRPAPRQAQSATATAAPAATSVPVLERPFASPPTSKRRRLHMPTWLMVPLLLFGAMIAGIFIQSVVFGQAAIALYGLAALVKRVPSRTTFTLALLAVAATVALLIVKSNVEMAQNFATYTFLFLVVGVISLAREVHKKGGGKPVYKRRRKK